MSSFSRRQFLGFSGMFAAGALLGGVPRLCQAGTTGIVREARLLLGTVVEVSLAGVSTMQADDALNAAFAEAGRLDAILSRHDSATPLSELNRSRVLADAPEELLAVLRCAREISQRTRGAFDVTVQPVVDFLHAHKNPQGRMTFSRREFDEVRKLVHFASLRVQGHAVHLERQGMGVTLDGIAKGRIADCMGTALHRLGVNNYLVNAGGDIVAHGMRAPGHPWRIAVESPFKSGDYPSTFSLAKGAVATSGGYEHVYDASGSHNHLVDPSSGKSPLAVRSVSVKAPTAMEADALATALSVMAAPSATRLINALPGHECLIIMNSGKQFKSSGWVM